MPLWQRNKVRTFLVVFAAQTELESQRQPQMDQIKAARRAVRPITICLLQNTVKVIKNLLLLLLRLFIKKTKSKQGQQVVTAGASHCGTKKREAHVAAQQQSRSQPS